MGAYALGAAAQAGDWLLNLDDTVVALVYAFVARMILTFWVIGVALGSLFYVVPRATFNALASGGMAFASWVLWAGLSGVSALGALVDPSVPYVVTSIGNAATILLLAPILLAVATLAMTMSGRWSLTLGAGTLAFALLSMTFLLSTTVLEAIGALATVQARCAARNGRPGRSSWPRSAPPPSPISPRRSRGSAPAAPRLGRHHPDRRAAVGHLRGRGRGRAVTGRGGDRAWLADRRWRVDGPDQRDADLVPPRRRPAGSRSRRSAVWSPCSACS